MKTTSFIVGVDRIEGDVNVTAVGQRTNRWAVIRARGSNVQGDEITFLVTPEDAIDLYGKILKVTIEEAGEMT